MTRRQIYTRFLVHILFYLLICLFCIFVLPRLAVFFLPFIIGWIISAIANPLVRYLEKHIKLVRKHGSMLVIIGVIAIIGAAIYGLGVVAVREVFSLVDDLPAIYEEFREQFAVLSVHLEELLKNVPLFSGNNNIEDVSGGLPEAFSDFLGGAKLPTISTASHAFHNVADGLLMAIMVFLSAYFFIVERENILKAISAAMPETLRKHVEIITDSFVKAVGGYFRAQLKLAVVVFAVLYIGFKIIGVKYSCLLAIVVALLDFLPVFGTGFVIWPWALWSLLVGDYMKVAALLVIYVLCQLIKQLLQPKMVGDSIGMAPLTTLIFLYSGYRMGGFLGMLIGIPVGMVLINFYQAGAFALLIEDIKNVSKDLEEHYWR